MKAPTRPDPPAQFCKRMMAVGFPIGLAGFLILVVGNIVGVAVLVAGDALILAGLGVLIRAED